METVIAGNKLFKRMGYMPCPFFYVFMNPFLKEGWGTAFSLQNAKLLILSK